MADEGNEDAKGLRTKLEETIGQNKVLTQQVSALTAEKLISEKGFDLVPAEELAAGGLEDMEQRASQLQAEKEAQRRDMVRSVFAQRGLEGQDLEVEIDKFLSGSSDTSGGVSATDQAAMESIRKTGSVAGEPVTHRLSTEGMTPRQMLESAF